MKARQFASEVPPGFSAPHRKGCICEAHRPLPGLASLTLLHPQLLGREAQVIIPPSLPAPPHPPSPILPMLLWLTARPPGSRAWKRSSVQASVKSTSSPRDPCPCSTNIWRTARTSGLVSLSAHKKIELKPSPLLHKKTPYFARETIFYLLYKVAYV